MKPDAVSEAECVFDGDRFSNIVNKNDGDFILSSGIENSLVWGAGQICNNHKEVIDSKILACPSPNNKNALKNVLKLAKDYLTSNF